MIFVKKAQDYSSNSSNAGAVYNMTHPKLGDLMHAVILENTIDEFERRTVLERVAKDTGYASPQTPLTPNLLSGMGSGLLGMLVTRMLGQGTNAVIMGASGMQYMGKVVSDYYLREADMEKNNTRVIL